MRAFFNLSAKNKLLVLKIPILLIYFKLRLRFIPFKKIVAKLHTETDDFVLTEERTQYIHRISITLHKISNILPWRCTCLEKALAGKYLLAENNIPSTLYLGATIGHASKFAAHAWLTCADIVLIGGKEKDRYAVVGSFK